MAHQRVIKEMREDCHCENEEFCPLESLIRSFNDRMLEQHNCVRLYRWNMGKRLKRPITWDEAYISWSDEGCAKRFSDVYREDLTWKQIYQKTMKGGEDND